MSCEIIAVLGPRGAGLTTLAIMLANYHRHRLDRSTVLLTVAHGMAKADLRATAKMAKPGGPAFVVENDDSDGMIRHRFQTIICDVFIPSWATCQGVEPRLIVLPALPRGDCQP